LLFLAFGLRKKKNRKYFVAWLILLAVSVVIMYLTMVAHVIIANTMIGS
jgi:hypothetical protein